MSRSSIATPSRVLAKQPPAPDIVCIAADQVLRRQEN